MEQSRLLRSFLTRIATQRYHFYFQWHLFNQFVSSHQESSTVQVINQILSK